jgi:hypothetical protein
MIAFETMRMSLHEPARIRMRSMVGAIPSANLRDVRTVESASAVARRPRKIVGALRLRFVFSGKANRFGISRGSMSPAVVKQTTTTCCANLHSLPIALDNEFSREIKRAVSYPYSRVDIRHGSGGFISYSWLLCTGELDNIACDPSRKITFQCRIGIDFEKR